MDDLRELPADLNGQDVLAAIENTIAAVGPQKTVEILETPHLFRFILRQRAGADLFPPRLEPYLPS